MQWQRTCGDSLTLADAANRRLYADIGAEKN